MIGYISLFEAISAYNTVVWICSTVEWIEYFGLEWIMHFSTFTLMPNDYNCKALCALNQRLGVFFFSMMSLGMNLCLCIDLILTLKQPFYPASRWEKWYLIGSFLFSIIVVGITWEDMMNTCADAGKAYNSALSNTIQAIVLSVYIMFALFSIIYSGWMLSRPGISSDIKNMFLRKHVSYTLGFIVIWSITLSGAYSSLYNSLDTPSLGLNERYVIMPNGWVTKAWIYLDSYGKEAMDIDAIEWISFMASLSTGFLLAYIRTREPYFKYRINKTVKSLFGEIHEKDKNEKDFNNTYSAFLNSSLNIELVHIILKCITMNN